MKANVNLISKTIWCFSFVSYGYFWTHLSIFDVEYENVISSSQKSRHVENLTACRFHLFILNEFSKLKPKGTIKMAGYK